MRPTSGWWTWTKPSTGTAAATSSPPPPRPCGGFSSISARDKKRPKRGGDASGVDLDQIELAPPDTDDEELIALDDALTPAGRRGSRRCRDS